jgi:uncharacterized UPF0160 family protein
MLDMISKVVEEVKKVDIHKDGDRRFLKALAHVMKFMEKVRKKKPTTDCSTSFLSHSFSSN